MFAGTQRQTFRTRVRDSDSGSGFLTTREFYGSRIGVGYRKNFGFGFRVSKLPVRVRVLVSVCLLSSSVFFSHFNLCYSHFHLQLLRLF